MKLNLKEFLVKEFVKTHKRIPNRSELVSLQSSYTRKYPTVNAVGLSASKVFKTETEFLFASAGSESSSSNYENMKAQSIIDIDYLTKEYEDLLLLQKDAAIDQGRILNQIQDRLKLLEKEINLQIMLSGKQDIFTYGIVEDFSVREHLREDLTTATILDNNAVSIGIQKTVSETLNLREVSYKLLHRRGDQVDFKVRGELTDILLEDEKYFKLESGSYLENDIVECIFELNFYEPKTINKIKYVLQAFANNAKIQEEVFISNNGVDYNQLSLPTNIVDNINYIDINNADEEQFKKIIIKLRKTAYDYAKENKFYYVFSFDYLGLIETTYAVNKKSFLYLGPYEVNDSDENPVDFSLATIKLGTCCVIPQKTSVSFFLSKNDIDYYKAGFSNEYSNVVSFENNLNENIFDDFSPVDSTSSYRFLVEDESLVDFNLSDFEVFLNVYLKQANAQDVNLNTLKIYRNIYENKQKNTGGFFSGWKKELSGYSCHLNISNQEGIVVDFGIHNSITIDGVAKGGKTFLSYGIHKLSLDAKFFAVANVMAPSEESLIVSERQLSKLDNFYPYNHKLLIEGFKYNKRFRGKKKYIKLGDFYGAELQRSESLDSFRLNGSYENYLLLEVDGDTYILTKDTDQGIGKLESFDIKYRNRSNGTSSNRLYIKAILETTDSRVSPKIDQIQVRVI